MAGQPDHWDNCLILFVPVGVRGVLVAVQALRHFPLIHTGGTDTAGVEGIPLVSAFAEPAVARMRLPFTLRAADVRATESIGQVLAGLCDRALHRTVVALMRNGSGVPWPPASCYEMIADEGGPPWPLDSRPESVSP
jgi:hypothetical protein